MSIKPEDILADDASFIEKKGVTIRKGSAAAILANADILADAKTSESEKKSALNTIAELMPAMIAAGMHRHVVWKNPVIQKIMQDNMEK